METIRKRENKTVNKFKKKKKKDKEEKETEYI